MFWVMGRRGALIRGWALINFSYLKGGPLFEVGECPSPIKRGQIEVWVDKLSDNRVKLLNSFPAVPVICSYGVP